MSTQTANIVNNKNLSYQYDWFQKTFPPVVQQVFDNFFEQDFKFSLLGICKNVNSIVDKAAYFVTKVKIDKQHDVFFRISETSIGLILERVLGRPNNPFDLNKLTELETKIVTTFNDCLFRAVVGFLKPAPPTLARTNFDVIYLVFVLTDQESGKSGRFVITLPDVLLEPETIQMQEDFPVEQFEKSTISARLDVGKTVFKLHEVKHLEVDDMVVFENSSTDKLRLNFRDWETDVLLKPNLSLVVPIDNDGGSEVSENENINIWDSIEVEMVGHFDAVDITLGELKKIQAGMVVDLASIYQNKVTLTVEDKPIASGELVIINDKYGVKITEVHAPKPVEEVYAPASGGDVEESSIVSQDEENNDFPEVTAGEGSDDDEEFDYSDFDLEEDI